MKTILSICLFSISFNIMACESNLLDHNFKKLASDESINLCESYEDKVILVVNTASKCGNTPQYEGLESLYEEYFDQGLIVLGFPSNNFFGQEPGTEEEIKDFCRLTYGVKFPMFEKTEVKGKKAHPFFTALNEASGTYPTWNFHKYVIGRNGQLVAEIGPRTKPRNSKIISIIEQELAK
ncbi:MAG: glutathione peroxidase [Gammaproteobacteria bacterium]|nr:glutathione peroxidase [Gammaproteobacteria bacterium]